MDRAHDRRDDLTLAGFRLLVYTWLDVTTDGDRIVEEVRSLLGRR